jgi:hypothetical protein
MQAPIAISDEKQKLPILIAGDERWLRLGSTRLATTSDCVARDDGGQQAQHEQEQHKRKTKTRHTKLLTLWVVVNSVPGHT